MRKWLWFITLLGFFTLANAVPINIVAAENFYGELAQEIGGNQVKVQSIINNPSADPHLFATSPSISKALSQAQIIIYNGVGYDSWIDQMLVGLDTKKVIIINVAALIDVKPGANPHLWYKPETFPKLAKMLAFQINQLRPLAKTQIDTNLQKFMTEHAVVVKAIAAIKAKYAGIPVIATEPVYGYMTDAMGLKMEGIDFQWKIMNDTDPTPKMIANYQKLLNDKKVKALFYNGQVTDSITKNMQDLAEKNGISIVGVTETMPPNTTINAWLNSEINATNVALARGVK